MTSGQADKRAGKTGRTAYRILGTAVVVAALGLVLIWIRVVRGGERPAGDAETVAAQRGPLTISVLEAGMVLAKDPVILSSSTPQRATILSIVPEGAWVHEGDLLVELDVSNVIDHVVDVRIMVKNAEAILIAAQERLVIVKSQAQSDVEQARLDYEFAQQDLKKYLEGQYPNDQAAAQGKIKLNQEELEKARDYLMWSQRLHEEKYLSDTQLKADELALSRAQLNLQVAQNDCNLLQVYTHQRQIAQLTSDVHQAQMALTRTEARARASIIQAEATLGARQRQYEYHLAHLARHEDEIARSKIYAPTDGTAIYATSVSGGHDHDDRRPLADGVDVWDRQELIYLQRGAAMVARVALHEANLQKVRVGMPVLLTFDALPGRKVVGTVTRIAPLPDSQSMWSNPDLKIYQTEIGMDCNELSLRNGMNCRVEIIIEQYADALYVPVQTVQRVGGQPAVYVLKDDGSVEERRVELGLDDNRVVQVAGGLQEGERVLLTPPIKAGAQEPSTRLADLRRVNNAELAEQIRQRLAALNQPAPPAPALKSPVSTAHPAAGPLAAGLTPQAESVNP